MFSERRPASEIPYKTKSEWGHRMRFNLYKIGEYLQKLAVLAIVAAPLDRHLTIHQIIFLWAVFSVIGLVGIEVERRAR
jgi:hypothetical protein